MYSSQCALPASDLKVHASLEEWLAGEQSVFFSRISFALSGGAHFASIFSSCTLWPAKQACQGAKISSEKHKKGTLLPGKPHLDGINMFKYKDGFQINNK
jgi:hypothetical protein